MKRLFLAVTVFVAACASTPTEAQPAPDIRPQSASIVGADGAQIGRATFTEAPRGLIIRIELNEGGLPPGWHGLHLHARGNCSDNTAGFQASGAHETAGHGAQHGLLNPNGPEAGDLPNIYVAQHGPTGAEVFSPFVTLHAAPIGDRQPLLDADGAALLIHAGADDHRSQPIGNAGARIACAALTPAP